jgi:very-short-patch-repair endonuclease
MPRRQDAQIGHPHAVHNALEELLAASDGVIKRRDALTRVSPRSLQWSLRQGELIRVLPGMYVATADDPHLIRAAALYAEPDGALSHTTALWSWQVLKQLPRPLHVTVPASRQPRGSGTVMAHRRYGELNSVVRGEFPVVPLERALVETARLLGRDLARATFINSVRERRTTVQRLQAELDKVPKVRRRPELQTLVTLLGEGCQSELELFGYTKVFRHPSMPEFTAQHRVRLGNRSVYLDLANDELRVAIELDGAEFHDSPTARERDRRRDVELAAHGWVVLRFSARRLREDPAGVRREVIAVLSTRRAQLLAG